MKTRILTLLALCMLAAPSWADGDIALVLYPERLPSVGNEIRVVTVLTQHGKPLTSDDLKVVHMHKIHLLIADPTLSDFQHVHPQPTPTPGSYLFRFTPKKEGGYRAWADITPSESGVQQYAKADLGEPKPPEIDTTESTIAAFGDMRFVLAFDKPPLAGAESTGSVTITNDKGEPLTVLEPLMGAYAHVVGIYDDYTTVAHTHPLGDPPQDETARGGPAILFHLAPVRPGFIKLFVQVKVNSKEIFVPFGIKVPGGAVN